jgi:hypothetical protein
LKTTLEGANCVKASMMIYPQSAFDKHFTSDFFGKKTFRKKLLEKIKLELEISFYRLIKK